MPWTIADPPNVAKNWSVAKQKACVKSAQAALNRGASEENSIFACIGAAENVDHMDQNQETPLDLSRQLRGNKKAPIAPLPPQTNVLEAQYFKELNQMVRFQHKIIRETVMTKVPIILKDARIDDYVDDTGRVMANARVQFAEAYPESRMAEMAGRAALATNRVNRAYYDRFYKILNVNPIVSEPWLGPTVKAFTETNVSLITKMTQTEFADVEEIILRGAQSGSTVKSVQAEITATFPKEVNRAKLIAQDQIQKFNGNLNRNRQIDAGVKKYQWVTSGDERVRSSHRAINGNIYAWRGSPRPPDGDDPGQAVRCRCRSRPIIE